MDKLCMGVSSSQPSPKTRGYLLTAITKLAVHQRAKGVGGSSGLTPEAEELLHKAGGSTEVELQERALEARALLK
jgi:hypothetical protein